MINLKAVDTEMISGISDNELEFLCQISTDHHCNEHNKLNQWTGLRESDESFLEQLLSDFDIERDVIDLDALDSYCDLDDATTNSLNVSEEEEVPLSTKLHTKSYAAKFKTFLVSKNLPDSIETMPVRYLNQYLRLFYASLRKEDGTFYAPASLGCIRAAINRYLTKAPYNRQINLKKDREFTPSNNMLKAMCSKYLKSAESSSDRSYKSMTDIDLQTLMRYFDRSNGKKLQEEVFFSIAYHKGYRGREWIRNLQVSNLKITADENGIEYADLETPSFSKNSKGSVIEKDYSNNKQSRIYSQPESPNCPVEAIKLYLSKIPPTVKDLFPAPVRKWNFSNKYWYSAKQVLGKNKLANMMSKISTDANLSCVFTNHCIRATCVTQLTNKGFSITDIQAVTGHKRMDSVQRYVKHISSEKRRKLSNALSESASKVSMKSSETIIMEQSNANINLTNSKARTDRIFTDCLFSNCTINIHQGNSRNQSE